HAVVRGRARVQWRHRALHAYDQGAVPLSPSLPESPRGASDHRRVHRALQHRVAHRALPDARVSGAMLTLASPPPAPQRRVAPRARPAARVRVAMPTLAWPARTHPACSSPLEIDSKVVSTALGAWTSWYALRLELFQRVDPLLRSWMGGEESSPAGALRLYEPSQRIDHHGLGIAGARENVHPVAVRFILFGAAIAAGDQSAGDGCDATTAGENLVENDHADAESSAQRLCLCYVAEVVVGELMGQHAPKLVIVGLLKETRRDIKFPPTATGRVDMGIVHDPNLNLVQGTRMIHGRDEGGHDAADTLGLLRIDRGRRGLGPASLGGLRCA